MERGRWLVYGANGFTGRLVAEEAARRGLRPVLAGRREHAVREVADRHGLDDVAFALEDPAEIARHLEGFEALLLVAGPFSATSGPAVEACLRTGTHYLDVTGEIPVFESVYGRHDEARARQVTLLPGVGFDVVPTDCLAARLKETLPEATHLELAFSGFGGTPSRGTLKTMVEGLPQGGAIRRAGRLEQVRAAQYVRQIPFRDKTRTAASIPWGDLSSAYRSTGIGDIYTYMAMPSRAIRAARVAAPMQRFIGTRPVQRALKSLIERRVDEAAPVRSGKGSAQIWGRASDPAGRWTEGTLVTPEPYRLTAQTAVDAVNRLLKGAAHPGALTPALAFGSGYIETFEGCDMEVEGPQSEAAE